MERRESINSELLRQKMDIPHPSSAPIQQNSPYSLTSIASTAMSKVLHDIDPNGDTLLILRNPNVSFAPWISDEVGNDALTSSAHNRTDATTLPQAETFTTSSCEPTLVDDCVSEEEIHYRVSSRHLTLASKRFKTMLSGESWKEGIRNEDDGLHHAPAEDWDAEALLVLLDVLHHRNRRVPRTVSLELLAKLAVLIDYYECAEALESFTERWVKHVKATSPIPSCVCRDLLLWMCIAYVLRLGDEFLQTTTVVMRRENEDLPTLGLPIVRIVSRLTASFGPTSESDFSIARIENSRTEAIGTVFLQLQDLVEEYRSPQYQCPKGASFECGSILFGALTREMELLGLTPAPSAPYPEWSVSTLYHKLHSIRSPSWSSMHKKKHPCDLAARVMAIADPVIRLASGPRLEDFEFI